MSEADLGKLKRRRTANRNVTNGLIVKIGDKIRKVQLVDDDKLEIEAMLVTLKDKGNLIKQLDEDILNLVPTDDMTEEIDAATQFEIRVVKETKRVELFLKQIPSDSASTITAVSVSKNTVKLPKLFIKRFYGDPLQWQQFFDTFDAVINKNESVSNIEKFTYLKGYLSGEAEKCLEGLQLTNENFEHALSLLKERYGNPQLIVSTHMNKLLKLEKIYSTGTRAAKELRCLHDKIESHVRSLLSCGINSDHYGPMLVPILLEKLPNDIRLEISRKLGKNNWKINEFMDIFKDETTARENCEYVKGNRREGGEQGGKGDQSSRREPGFTTQAFATSNKLLSCTFCKQGHYSDKCTVVTELEARKKFVATNRLCFKCLRTGHIRRNCQYRRNCYTCKSDNHHTALCDKEYNEQTEAVEKPTVAIVDSKTSVMLQTATSKISSIRQDKEVDVKILFDPGSQRSYVSKKIVNSLKLKPVSSQKMIIKAFGDTSNSPNIVNEHEFFLKGSDGRSRVYLKGFSVPLICSPISGQRFDVALEKCPGLKNLKLADNGKNDGEIDVLIGADYYWEMVTGGVKRFEEGLVAIDSKFGWLLSGPFQGDERVPSSVNCTHVLRVGVEVSEELSLKESVEKFWDLDSVGVVDSEKSVYEKFEEDIRFDGCRYEVKLPFKESHPVLEDNYDLCINRLKSLKRKLEKSPDMLKEYDKVIKGQFEAGVIEKVVSVGEPGQTVYLPHRAVVREDKQSTKLRVVFDASAKVNGPSLNDCLYKGPSLNPLLYDILLRFRTKDIVLIGDIEKAFLQVSVAPEHRDYLRFLWFKDAFVENPEIEKYRYTRVIFGSSSSQFLLNGTLKNHSEKYTKIDAGYMKKILRSFYVDDLNCGVSNVKEGVDLYKKIKIRFADGNFNVRKWRTNNEQLRDYILEKEELSNVYIQEIDNNENVEVLNKSESFNNGGNLNDKVLGIIWNEKDDVLVINLLEIIKSIENITVTKRNILKLVASFYDPMGLIQPFVVRLKLLFQEVCLNKRGWDEILNDDFTKKYHDIVRDMKKVKEIVVERCYCLSSVYDPFVEITLHGFSDASEKAYGCCVYLKFVTVTGYTKINLVTSKSRIAPCRKKLTIPRLELMGNLLLSRLMCSVLKAFAEELEIDEYFCWSDSKITLAWIKAEKREFKTFVHNRVIEIRKNVSGEKWFYCKTADNPADIITRENFDEKLENKWWNGPVFLLDVENYISTNETKYNISDDSPELVQKYSVLSTAATKQEEIIDVNKYNDLLKLLRITAYVERFVNNMKNRREKKQLILNRYLLAEEIIEAKRYWIMKNQEVMRDQLDFSDIEKNLNVKEDEDGVLRSYSRLKNSNIKYDTKFPIMLSKDHKLSELLVNYCHVKIMHGGVKHTLEELRVKYWVTSGRSFVKKIIKSCVTCNKLNSRPYEYPTHSDLPKTRFIENNPFNATGIDYLGPLLCLPVYGDVNKLFKAWIVIYTCATTRAIVLDVVNDASASCFVQSLSRFIARRGCPSTILSDNGSSFTAAETQQFVANKFIRWKFNVESAPWWGGLWERLVASVKSCIKKVVGTKRLTFVEIHTLVLEIEVILNNRPLCDDYDDNVEDIITPNHLLFGKRLAIANENMEVAENSLSVDLTKRQRYLKTVLLHFWNRWRREYVTSLRDIKSKNQSSGASKIKVNDIVIVYEEKSPRHLWRLARVNKLLPGNDGQVRAAEIMLGKTRTLTKRPINRLYPIETNERHDTGEVNFVDEKDIVVNKM